MKRIFARNSSKSARRFYLRFLSSQVFQAVNNFSDENFNEIDFETLMKNAAALTRAAAYKKKTGIDSRSVPENGADQFQSLVFEATADENPELYRQAKKFIEEKNHENVRFAGEIRM